MHAVRVLLLVLTLCIVLTALAFIIMTADTFHERYAHHAEERDRAVEYMKATHCRRGSTARSKLGSYQLCDKSEKILSGSPLWFALLDVSHIFPPMLASVAGRLKEDMFNGVCTMAGLGLLWSCARKFFGLSPTAPSQSVPTATVGLNAMHEDTYTTADPVWAYQAGSLPRWQPRRRRLSNF